MKTLGMTNDGNYIVEMSRDEHAEFISLESSIDKKWTFYDERILHGKDLAPIFAALGELASVKRSINNIKDYIEKLHKAFGGTE